MITKWKVSNFKSIREETELELFPLTIFAGTNSSGKSTFIQSILLLAQTLAHKVGSRSVVLNGTLTSLGQFDDLRSNGGLVDQITIKCTCRPISEQNVIHGRRSQFASRGFFYYGRSKQLQEVSCEISFDADPSSSDRDLLQIQPRLFTTKLTSVSRDEDNVDKTASISIYHTTKEISELERVTNTSEIDEQLRRGLAYGVEMDEESMSEVHEEFRSAKPIGCILRHFLPDRIVYSIDTIEEDANAIAIALQDDSRQAIGIRRNLSRDLLLSKEILAVLREILKDTIDFDQLLPDKYRNESLFDLDVNSLTFKEWNEKIRSLPIDLRRKVQQVLRDNEELFDLVHAAMKSLTTDTTEKHAIVHGKTPRMITEANWYLDNFYTSSLKYLGPLRDAPKPLYPLAPATEPNDVGLRGEHTASILELHKNKKIKYIPSSYFKDSVIERKTVTRTLEAAVVDWLQYLGVASSVQSRDQGKLGHELKVCLSNSEFKHDLTHVGVGVSQVLPILVLCFLADTDSTLVFEQPELHLHPKVQALLGDFFLSMALSNKQCIVETHSEYLIDRLRFRIAAAPSEEDLSNQTKIYFVEKPLQDSIFREVDVNEYGAIMDWPEGFFDQSQYQAEEILKAAAKKRKSRRGNTDA